MDTNNTTPTPAAVLPVWDLSIPSTGPAEDAARAFLAVTLADRALYRVAEEAYSRHGAGWAEQLPGAAGHEDGGAALLLGMLHRAHAAGEALAARVLALQEAEDPAEDGAKDTRAAA